MAQCGGRSIRTVTLLYGCVPFLGISQKDMSCLPDIFVEGVGNRSLIQRALDPFHEDSRTLSGNERTR